MVDLSQVVIAIGSLRVAAEIRQPDQGRERGKVLLRAAFRRIPEPRVQSAPSLVHPREIDQPILPALRLARLDDQRIEEQLVHRQSDGVQGKREGRWDPCGGCPARQLRPKQAPPPAFRGVGQADLPDDKVGLLRRNAVGKEIIGRGAKTEEGQVGDLDVWRCGG